MHTVLIWLENAFISASPPCGNRIQYPVSMCTAYLHLVDNTVLYSVALRYREDESIYMHHVNISFTGWRHHFRLVFLPTTHVLRAYNVHSIHGCSEVKTVDIRRKWRRHLWTAPNRICALTIAYYCTLSLSAIWMAKMCAPWHLNYRIQCICTLSPSQPSSQPTITTNHNYLNISITGSNAYMRLAKQHNQPSPSQHLDHRIQCITGGAFRRLPQLGSLALQNNDIAGS